MATRLADRLAAARRRQFVGRAHEKEIFANALVVAEPPYSLFFIYGPGGVGKSSLLREFVAIAQRVEALIVYLDGRTFEATPDAFLANLNNILGIPASDDCFSLLERSPQRFVLLIDTFEALSSLDVWLGDRFLPQIPANALVVIAGRHPPSTFWRADSGWQNLLKIVSLRNLTPEESRQLLQLHTMPVDAQEEVVAFTHGHPLAISLVMDLAEQGTNFRLSEGPNPDVVRLLLQRLVSDAPSQLHKLSLEACAFVRYLTEGLLSAMLESPDVYQIFDWLRGLSFVESGRMGLFPHDLVREAIIADIRWRNPDRYAQLHQRAASYYQRRIQETHGSMQRRLLTDLFYLHRHNLALRPFFEREENERIWIDSIRPEDIPTLIDCVRRHEGDLSARFASFWFERQPDVTLVLRNNQQRPVGMLMKLALHRASPEEITYDPATRQVWQFLQSEAPLRANEQATFFRFWMDETKYQEISTVQSRIFLACIQHYITTPGLAYTIFPCAQPKRFAALFAYADLHRKASADFEVEGRHYGVYCHDWRSLPPAPWLDLLAQRDIAAAASNQPIQQAVAKPTTASLLVLSEPEFADAVREALRQVTRLDELGRSPLIRSRLVVERSGVEATTRERSSILQRTLQEAAQVLQSSPKTNRAYRALHHTYFQPAATQELAAEVLDLPFSTYRRHLKEGIDHLIETLWMRELGNG